MKMFLKIYIYNFSCDNFAVVRFLSGYYNLLSLASEIVLKFLLFFLWKAIHICTAESFYHSRDTITLLIGYIPIQNKKIESKKDREFYSSQPEGYNPEDTLSFFVFNTVPVFWSFFFWLFFAFFMSPWRLNFSLMLEGGFDVEQILMFEGVQITSFPSESSSCSLSILIIYSFGLLFKSWQICTKIKAF